MYRFLRFYFTCTMLLALAFICTVTFAEKGVTFAPKDRNDAYLKAIELLERTGFTAEYGGSDKKILKRWASELNIWVGGDPTPEDLETLDRFISQVQQRLPDLPAINRVRSVIDANVRILYVDLDEMAYYDKHYVNDSWGFCTTQYDDDWKIYSAMVQIASDVTDQTARNHILQEELVAALGLTNDHYAYSDSIIYEPWTTVQHLSEVDWLMLELLYSPSVSPGMSYTKVRAKLFHEYIDMQ